MEQPLNNATPLPQATGNKYKLPAIILVAAILIISAFGLMRYVSKNPSYQNLLPFGKTPDTFKITNSSPKEFEAGYSVVGEPTFVFNQKLNISEKDINKYVTLSPAVPGSWHLADNNQALYFSSDKKQKDNLVQIFPFDSSFTITIKKDIPSISGKKLDIDKKYVFRTYKNPKFTLDLDKKLINSYPDKTIDVELSANLINEGSIGTSYKVQIRKATIEELTTYFVSPDQFTFVYPTQKSTSKPIASFDAPVKINSPSSSSLELPAMKTGLYYVTISDQLGTEDLFINIANHVNQAYLSADTMHVWVTDREGNSLGGVNTEIYSLNKTVQPLASGKTDDNGLVKFKDKKPDVLLTKINNDVGITYISNRRYYVLEKYKVFSATDRPVYRPGDTVHYKAVIRTKIDGKYQPLTNEDVYFKFMPNGYTDPDKDYKKIAVDENGTIAEDIILPNALQNVQPIIAIAVKNDDTFIQIDSHDLKVESYRKPDMDINVMTNETEYISSDAAHMAVTAKTLYGSPMSNMKFSYRVVANPYTEIENRTLENIANNDYSYYGGGTELVTGEGMFDKKGKAQFEFSTFLKDLESSQIITVEISPKINASPSIGTIAKLVHRGTYAIFYKNIQSNIEDGIKGTLLTLDHQMIRKAVSNKDLSISLYKKRSDNTDEFIEEQKVTSNNDGSADFTFASLGSGSYELVTRGSDERGNIITTRYSVYVGEKVKNETMPSKTLTITLSQPVMNIGDTNNTLTVKANYDIKDLAITLNTATIAKNSDHTINLRNIAIKKVNSRTFTMPLSIDPAVELPFTVQAFSVSDGQVVSSGDEIKINSNKKKIATKVSFDKKNVRPGDTIQVTIETSDADGKPVAADNSLSLIDSAILQIGKIGDDIYNTFFANTYSSYLTSFNSTTGIYKNREGGGGGCFLTGTEIKTLDGSKPIELIREGDIIITRASEINNQLIEDRVTKTYRHVVDEYLTINKTFHVTPIHRIFVNNRWQTAAEARVGDMLLDEHGNYIAIQSITRHVGQFVVYNLTTEKTHTFIAAGFYVHNDKGEAPRQNFADTVYWNPHITTDSSGKASVKIKLPDNITSYTAHVYSNTKDSQFGQGTNELISKREIVIIPITSNYYFEGDKPTISALVQNNSGKEIQGKLTLKIPEKNVNTEQKLTISNEDFESIKYKIDLTGAEKEILVDLAFTDSSGIVLDAVKIKKPVLPKAAIQPHWEAFMGSHTIEFNPSYPQTDFNMLQLFLVQHPAAGMFSTNGFDNLSYGYTRDMDIETGIRLYVYSALMARTNEGKIPVAIYPYATLKNEIRETIYNALSSIVKKDAAQYWIPGKYSNESAGAISLAVLQGLDEASRGKILTEISNISQILNSVRSIVSKEEYFVGGNQTDTVLKIWAGSRKELCADAACIAAKVLSGDTTALSELRKQAIPSASDRLLWNTSEQRLTYLPILAMVEKGSPEDATKAIIGLSFIQQYGSADLSLLAGVDHAIKNNMIFEKPTMVVKANNAVLFDSTKADRTNYFLTNFSTKNIPDGKLKVEITTGAGIPVYGIAAGMQYDKSMDTTKALLAKKSVTRTLRSLPDGKIVDQIPAGESGLVELKIPNDYAYTSNSLSSAKEFLLIDAISPQYMFLNQSSGNSPQYENTLKNLYGSVNDAYGYTHFQQYSDQFVMYNSTSHLTNIIFPYAVWNIAEGTYYQPRTSLLYPVLGVITGVN